MTVAFVMLILSLFGFMVKKDSQYKYLLFSVLILSLLYIFFVPPQEYDLKREYDFIEYIKGLNIRQVYDASYGTGNRLLSDVQGTSKVYLFFAFIISKIPISHLLVFVTCFIVYGLSAKRILSVAEYVSASSSAIAAAFLVLLFTLDYRSVSGIRNMLAYAVFAFILYTDLVEKKNRLLCFVCYILLCQVHMTVAIFVVLRLALFLGNKVSKWALIVIAFAAFTIRDIALTFLERYSTFEFIRVFLYKNFRYILRYGERLAEYGYRRAYSYLAFIIVMLIIYLICKKLKLLDERMNSYNLFFILTIAITIGAIRQYDFFVRNCMLIAFLSIPYTVRYFNSAVQFNRSAPRIRVSGQSGPLVAIPSHILVFVGVLYMAAFNIYTFYIPMDGHFFM